VRCDYCNRENPLPPDVVAQRQRQVREVQAANQAARIYQDQQQVAKSTRRIGLWITLFTVLPAVIIPLVIVLRVTSSVDNAIGNINIPPPPTFNIPNFGAAVASAVATVAPPDPVATTARPAADPKPAEERVRAILKEKDGQGCRILMAAAQHQGSQSFTATMSRGPLCAIFIGVASADDEKLNASLTTPFNETVPASSEGKELIFPYCASTSGSQPHQLKVNATTNDPYVFAAVDCPKAVAFPKGSVSAAAPAPVPPPKAAPVARPPTVTRPRH